MVLTSILSLGVNKSQYVSAEESTSFGDHKIEYRDGKYYIIPTKDKMETVEPGYWKYKTITEKFSVQVKIPYIVLERRCKRFFCYYVPVTKVKTITEIKIKEKRVPYWYVPAVKKYVWAEENEVEISNSNIKYNRSEKVIKTIKHALLSSEKWSDETKKLHFNIREIINMSGKETSNGHLLFEDVGTGEAIIEKMWKIYEKDNSSDARDLKTKHGFSNVKEFAEKHRYNSFVMKSFLGDFYTYSLLNKMHSSGSVFGKVYRDEFNEEWKLYNKSESVYHLLDNGKDNYYKEKYHYSRDKQYDGDFNFKFVEYNEEASREFVFDKYGGILGANAHKRSSSSLYDFEIVNMGTFNFVDSGKSVIGHGAYDVAPYLRHGNFYNDPTSCKFREDISLLGPPAYVADEQKRIWYSLKTVRKPL